MSESEEPEERQFNHGDRVMIPVILGTVLRTDAEGNVWVVLDGAHQTWVLRPERVHKIDAWVIRTERAARIGSLQPGHDVRVPEEDDEEPPLCGCGARHWVHTDGEDGR